MTVSGRNDSEYDNQKTPYHVTMTREMYAVGILSMLIVYRIIRNLLRLCLSWDSSVTGDRDI